MIEKIVLDYLKNSLDIPVYTEIPSKPPQRFVLIEKTGGGSENLVKSSTIACQSYGKSLYDASAINEDVKALMDVLGDNHPKVNVARLNSDYNFTDLSNKRYRYQCVYDITHY